MMRITAHAGCENTPLGSMEGVLRAKELGADAVELDLRLLGETVVLSHDPVRPERKEPYVPLEEVLICLRDSEIRFNCDLKEEQVFVPALELFEAYGMTQRLDFTGDVPQEAFRQVKAYGVYLNAEHLMDGEGQPFTQAEAETLAARYAEKCQSWKNVHGLNICIDQLTDANVAVLHANRIALSVWTVDDQAGQKFCVRQNFWSMTTNRVAQALRLRDRETE